jgi:hypothetical protein
MKKKGPGLRKPRLADSPSVCEDQVPSFSSG